MYFNLIDIRVRIKLTALHSGGEVAYLQTRRAVDCLHDFLHKMLAAF